MWVNGGGGGQKGEGEGQRREEHGWEEEGVVVFTLHVIFIRFFASRFSFRMFFGDIQNLQPTVETRSTIVTLLVVMRLVLVFKS